jgi:hypothetical protein
VTAQGLGIDGAKVKRPREVGRLDDLVWPCIQSCRSSEAPTSGDKRRPVDPSSRRSLPLLEHQLLRLEALP